MRSREFIFEYATGGKINPETKAVISNTHTFPDQNMYHGSGYLHSRYLLAVAPAGAGDTPDAHMPVDNFASGDPTASPYHPMEEEMIDRAAKNIGDNSKRTWGNRRSEEPDGTHKVSPVSNWNKKK
jgi:hypothetical protein